MSTFVEDSVDSVPIAGSTHPFDDVGEYSGYDSQRFDEFSASQQFSESDLVEDSTDDVFASQPPIYGDYSNGKGFDGALEGSDGPILPPPSELEPEEGFALRDWRRQNAIRLEEKEKREKELLSQIIDEADQYKVEFYRKREITCENNKAANREKEKIFLVNHEKFHAEADKNYWKAIAELIPNEVPAIEKKRGKKDQEKKPSITVVQGPKPGKPTDLSRMRQIIIKLKHNTPPHLKPSPPATTQESKTDNDAVAAAPPKAAAVVRTTEAVVVA